MRLLPNSWPWSLTLPSWDQCWFVRTGFSSCSLGLCTLVRLPVPRKIQKRPHLNPSCLREIKSTLPEGARILLASSGGCFPPFALMRNERLCTNAEGCGVGSCCRSCCPCLLLPPLWHDGSGRLSSRRCADDIVIWALSELQTALSFTSLYLNDVIMQEVMSPSQLPPTHALSLAATFLCAGSLLVLLTRGSHCKRALGNSALFLSSPQQGGKQQLLGCSSR